MAEQRIDSLTPAQEAMLAVYRDRYTAIGLSTEPTDRAKVEKAVVLAYELAGLKPPSRIVWEEDPPAGARRACQFAAMEPNPEVVSEYEMLHKCCYGSQDAYWLAFYQYFRKEVGVDGLDQIEGLHQMLECGWWWPLEDAVVLTPKPNLLKLQPVPNQRVAPEDGPPIQQLHCEDGPAIQWPSGFCLYALQGIIVPESVVLRQYNASDVVKEDNAEVRRIMLARMGDEAFFEGIGAQCIHEDEWGKLYRYELAGEPITAVRVVNSTKEPDGSYKIYWFRCHPELRPLLGTSPDGRQRFGPPQKLTAKNAVAAGYGMTGEEYHPAIQT